MPIIAKFLSVMGIFGLFAIAVAVFSASQMRDINNSYTTLVEGNAAATVDIARANREVQATRGDISDLMIADTQADNVAAKAEITAAEQAYTDDLAKAAAAAPAFAADIDALSTQGLSVVDDQCAASIAAGLKATAPADVLASQQMYLTDCSSKFPPLVAAVAAENDRIAAATTQQAAALSGVTGSTIGITYAGIIGGLVVVMAIGFFAIRAWVVMPIKGLQAVMGRLAGGDFKASVEGGDRGDELGGMARAVQVFKDAGLEKLRLESEARALAARMEADRQAAEAERAEAARQLEVVVLALADGLERLSKGDLLFRLTTPFNPAYEKLRGDFNEAMSTLQETMKAIAMNTHGVRAGAGEIAQASDDLSRRTEQQAASLEETAAALDEITATVRKTAENASLARRTVETAKGDAEQSGEIVRETVNAMSGIEMSSRKIGNIIGVIDEIAFQTNLLALNAGVEAARAGDAGRGFAVVATEVRALAQRSAEAAKEIKSLISASGQQVDNGVKLVGETGKSLARIVEQVGRLNGLVGEIAAAAQEQATGLNQVNTAVNQMDQVTQQNAAMVEESTAASHSLAGEAEALFRLVGQFSIGHVAETAARPARKAPAAKAGKARTAAHGGMEKVVSFTRRESAPQAALAAADDWSEF